MYRILLQTKTASVNSPATYQYLADKGVVWETEDNAAALERYELELDNYKKSIMTLIKVVEVDLNPTAIGCACPDDCPSCPPVEPTPGTEGGESTDPTPEVTE